MAFRNILERSSEYIIENWICLFSVLSLPAMYQLRIIAKNGLNEISPENGINLVVSICLLLVPLCLFFVYFFHFSPKKKRYSVVYLEMKSESALVVILTILSILRPYFIALFALMLPHPVNHFFCLAYNIIHFLFTLICAPFHLSLITYLLFLSKTLIGLTINVCLLFG